MALDIEIEKSRLGQQLGRSVNQYLPYGWFPVRKGCWNLDGKSWVPKLSHRASARGGGGGGLVLLVGLLLCLIVG